MKRILYIPPSIVPTNEQIKSHGIRNITLFNDFKSYVRPVMTIEYDQFNNRAKLRTKEKLLSNIKEEDHIKGEKQIIKKLKELVRE